ncbi:MAG: hypothetical protein GXZ03_06260 [Proteiniphilum sp.]|nr:hypothetical protein [Proteiniphilum sp.]
MRKRSKKHIYLPIALAVYAIVMAVIGYPKYKSSEQSMYQFWGVLAGTILLSVILHFILKRREKNRDKFR